MRSHLTHLPRMNFKHLPPLNSGQNFGDPGRPLFRGFTVYYFRAVSNIGVPDYPVRTSRYEITIRVLTNDNIRTWWYVRSTFFQNHSIAHCMKPNELNPCSSEI